MSVFSSILKKFFKTETIYFSHYLSIDGWLTEQEAKGLKEVAALLPKKSVVVEIGSWKGKSTWCIAHGLKKGTINCIDPFNAAGEEGSKELYKKTQGETSLIEQFRNNIKDAPASATIKTHQGYSSDFIGSIHQIDFLFIDGDHSIEGCKFDFENFAHELKPGGFLAFHDYYPDRHELGPTWVIDELVRKSDQFTHVKDYDSLCVFRKNS